MRFKDIILSSLSIFCIISCTGRGNGAASQSYSPDESCAFAKGFCIERNVDFTSVTIRNPWDTLEILERYILVGKDAQVPENLPEGNVVKVPVEMAVVYTSVQAAIIEQLGCTDALCGVCEPEYITSPEIHRRIVEGSVADLGNATAPNIEKMMDLKPDVIIASPYENSGFGAAAKLGIPIILAADYLESHPLGRTEWVRFFSLLFCKESAGDSIFNVTRERYETLKNLAASTTNHPTVFLERKYGSAWSAPSGTSYIGKLQEDAGAEYVFKETSSAAVVQISTETVLDRASDADFWLLKYGSDKAMTYDELKEEYPPYAQFGAFKRRTVYGCNTVATTYYDDITLHPDYVLEDLIAIYHPELLPGHEFRYYHPLQ